ncbi:Fis family transcriptional regulator [Bacillus sp. NMCC4]|uniref:sigma-70 family RNA polymerase sigma factor n=1 Tax=unclassified Bacillus (in: firmicutes) TaxID=185979 RepID=UPI000D0242D4|nr:MULTISPECIES: sigma-70 family RNA polymerase sigma factor [unclassified Bacillus (in: firmicutes)]PRS41622.1 Fis family transcriptional regulator [Bacillus sp. NMCC4]PRS75599.1 Fis family transcriptional regulator [Bacillus sp. LNXM65]
MQDLLIEYKRALKDARKRYEPFREKEDKQLSDQEKHDKKIIASMVSDLEYVVEWLQIGRQPGARRGLDRRSVYQRTILANPEVLEALSYEYTLIQENEREFSERDKKRIDEALSVLTDREKDVFFMHTTQGLSFSEIANMLDVKKGTVQKHMERARTKMSKKVQERLFEAAE